MSKIFIIMGVSGTGKSTLGKALAKQHGGIFFEGDDYHSEINRKKMAAGEALTDEDRQVWLYAIAGLIAACSGACRPSFISCSALKESYREILRLTHPDLQFIFLTASSEILRERLKVRHAEGEHFMPPSLLDSQLADLEEPEKCTRLDASKPIDVLVSEFSAIHQKECGDL